MSSNTHTDFSEPLSDSFMKSWKKNEERIEWLRNMWHAAKQAAIAILIILPFPLYLLLRTRLGERYLSWVILGFSFVAMMGCIVLYELDSEQLVLDRLCLMALVPTLIGVMIAHKVNARMRSQRGEQWHSRSSGEPWPIWKRLSPNPSVAELAFEPALLILAAIAISLFTPAASVYLVLATIAIYLRFYLESRMARTMYLDALDQRIESEAWANLLDADSGPLPVHGYVVPGANAIRKPLRVTAEEAARRYRAQRETEPKPSYGDENGVANTSGRLLSGSVEVVEDDPHLRES